ncbi:YutD family protein [Paenibacillus swuensis]|uniref:YutD family protein n=1 Tax=Paenibacillus swuensis TaxID=1178515 RepID=UPI000838F521|nr:YutD family protein [Paenibacillus swuensis]
MIQLTEKTYEIIQEYKNGWNAEAFRERYSEVLERYDYIMGDWGYSQLRLRGFFREENPKATRESSVACLQDYLNEYCNFGCAYFVLEKITESNFAAGDKAKWIVVDESKPAERHTPKAPEPKGEAQQDSVSEGKGAQDGKSPRSEGRSQDNRRNQGRYQDRNAGGRASATDGKPDKRRGELKPDRKQHQDRPQEGRPQGFKGQGGKSKGQGGNQASGPKVSVSGGVQTAHVSAAGNQRTPGSSNGGNSAASQPRRDGSSGKGRGHANAGGGNPNAKSANTGNGNAGQGNIRNLPQQNHQSPINTKGPVNSGSGENQ